ncbi:hypothetical protein [Parerythrobacter lacustris]|uniref:Phosphopantetheine adenylyltransferase n=1 Tax=Parerythrobacter lacustris TaxID=2969984 RepID=A0ABT1XNT4_9SPHN|nr:hypothetical protein [Parerythrobacter lacustris]MCR2833316.1 hypothetical protein [Parerythrobacter lacustris]
MLQPIFWLILAAVHAMPALAFFRPAQMQSLYRVGPDNPLFLLMHHRAALFLAVFITCIIAAFHPPSRPLASVVAAISMTSFLFLWWRAGCPPQLKMIATVDLLGMPVLVLAAAFAFGLIGR